ncbi:lichenan permease IIC component [Peptococcaceae bacterium CEB3]|nr:lichenan permease IIC component [Peptococcaceae bacterium CEB3]
MSFIDKTSKIIEDKIAPPLIKVSENKYIDAIQKTFVSFMPLLIIGSVFILIAALPIPGWDKIVAPLSGKLWGAVNSTFGLMSIGIALGVGYYLSSYYHKKDSEVDPFSGALITLFCFLSLYPVGANANGSTFITADNLGSTGIFAAIIVGIITVEIYRILINKRITIKMPEGVPPMVAGAFTALIPGFVAITLWWLVRQVMNIDIPVLIMNAFKPLVAAGSSVYAQGAAFLIDRLLWFVGIHGTNVVTSVMEPIWTQMLAQNVAAVKAALPAPEIVTEPFLNVFVRVSFLPLIVLMLRSKVKRYRTLGKLALPAAVFNIAEPIMYGLPLVLNPLLFIPWIVGYMFVFVFDFVMVAIHLVPVPYIMVPWTMPGPIAAFLGTGGSVAAAILSTASYVIMGFIWYPFFKALEKRTLREEGNEESDSGMNLG